MDDPPSVVDGEIREAIARIIDPNSFEFVAATGRDPMVWGAQYPVSSVGDALAKAGTILSLPALQSAQQEIERLRGDRKAWARQWGDDLDLSTARINRAEFLLALSLACHVEHAHRNGWVEWVNRSVEDRATLQSAEAQLSALKGRVGELEEAAQWVWAFEPMVMADANLCAIWQWNNDGPADERLSEEIEALKFNHAHIRRQVRSLNERLQSAESHLSALKGGLASCEGEQEHFETWAQSEGYDMDEHPLHYLFLDQKTYAARQGWKAALAFARALLSSPVVEP